MRTGSIALPKWTPMVRKIILGIAGIWLFSLLSIQWFGWDWVASIRRWTILHPAWEGESSIWSGWIWQAATYMVHHDLASPFHVFINGLMLWFFGPVFESRWGSKPFLNFVVLCGVGAGVFTALLGWLIPSFFGNPVVGLSGAILGLIAAFSLVFPRQPIYLFFILRIEGRWLLPLTIVMDTLLFLTQPGSFAYATHMGGLLMGYLLVTGKWRPGPTLDRIRLARLQSKRRHLRVVRDSETDRTLH